MDPRKLYNSKHEFENLINVNALDLIHVNCNTVNSLRLNPLLSVMSLELVNELTSHCDQRGVRRKIETPRVYDYGRQFSAKK